MRLTLMFAMALMASPAAAQLALPPDEARAPSRLVPLDPASEWHKRFAEAGQALVPAIARGDEAEWLPLFGGQWLSAGDRARIAAALADETGAFRRVFAYRSASEIAILGWQPPGGDAPYAGLSDRPEGDAILCWRASGGTAAWPQTAAEAEDARRHACVRVSYSVRFDPPTWRAFMDPPPPAGD
jgi:hypothetical protein